MRRWRRIGWIREPKEGGEVEMIEGMKIALETWDENRRAMREDEETEDLTLIQSKCLRLKIIGFKMTQ